MVLLLAAYVSWYRNAYIAASVFSVLAILTRLILDLLAPILILYFALAIHGLSIKAAMKYLAIYAGIYCILMAPWWLHNYKAYLSFVRLNLGSGIALYSGNNPLNQTGGMDYNLQTSVAPFDEIANPVDRRQGAATRSLELHKRRSEAVFDPGRQAVSAILASLAANPGIQRITV